MSDSLDFIWSFPKIHVVVISAYSFYRFTWTLKPPFNCNTLVFSARLAVLILSYFKLEWKSTLAFLSHLQSIMRPPAAQEWCDVQNIFPHKWCAVEWLFFMCHLSIFWSPQGVVNSFSHSKEDYRLHLTLKLEDFQNTVWLQGFSVSLGDFNERIFSLTSYARLES